MKKKFQSVVALSLVMALSVGLAACSSTKDEPKRVARQA